MATLTLQPVAASAEHINHSEKNERLSPVSGLKQHRLRPTVTLDIFLHKIALKRSCDI